MAKRSKLFKSLCLLASLATGTIIAQADPAIRVSTPQGESAIVLLAEQPVLTADSNEVNVTAGENSFTFPLENYVDIVFVDSEYTGVKDIMSTGEAPLFSFIAGSATVSNLKQGNLVRLYTLDGSLKASGKADGDGNVTLDLAGHEKGVYLVTVNGISFKVLL